VPSSRSDGGVALTARGKTFCFLFALMFAFDSVSLCSSLADNFPSRLIRLIVPSSAGGVHDVIARIWADRVKSSLGSIVVENRSGGGASIAINAVAQSQPDGYTFLLGSTSNLVLREGLGNRVYDAARDLVPASIFATTSTSITVNPSVPATTVQELIAHIKANPGKLSYGSGGIGAITHITVEMFKQTAGGLDIVHIPYKSVVDLHWHSYASMGVGLTPCNFRKTLHWTSCTFIAI
jgi:tripartite-type tricarboxylate transporter receptor subunit TctC